MNLINTSLAACQKYNIQIFVFDIKTNCQLSCSGMICTVFLCINMQTVSCYFKQLFYQK